MDRVGVFIDAGYLFAQGSILLGGGAKLPRSQVLLDHVAVVSFFREVAEKRVGAQLLRVYWYDGTAVGPTAQHNTLAFLDDVKVRLGFVNSSGQQKGVDSLIVTDMITLARNRSITDAILLSGDEDLRVGVQQAQEFGVRVHLIGIKPIRGSQSVFLMQEADTTSELDELAVRKFLSIKLAATPASLPASPATASPAAIAPSADPLEMVAGDVATTILPSELATVVDLVQRTKQIPYEHDAKLLAGGRKALGHDLSPAEKKRVRDAFLLRAQARLSP